MIDFFNFNTLITPYIIGIVYTMGAIIGKTYTMAKVIEALQMPTLIMTHNKTLAAQLYSEFRGFFPDNHVEYFISYYDYYQPEAYRHNDFDDMRAA